jgi:hypothetical protein
MIAQLPNITRLADSRHSLINVRHNIGVQIVFVLIEQDQIHFAGVEAGDFKIKAKIERA